MDELSKKLADLVEGGLFPNAITFITQVVSTLILFYFLKKLVWKPMEEFMAKRSSIIVNELESAKKARLEAEEMKLAYESEIKNAKNEALEILENARIQANQTKEQIISDAQREAEYKLELANKQIASERAKVEKELKSHVVDIAFSAAEKVLSEKIDDGKNRQLIDKFINEIGE